MFKQKSVAFEILKSNRGMSLIEILIALTLLGIAGAFVASNVYDRLQEGKVESAKIQIQRLGDVLKDYRRKCNAYPTTEQGLDALLGKPTSGPECRNYPPNGFLEDKKIPTDPWDMEYYYESDGRTYTIISYGSDNLEGGEGYDADISSNDI